MAEDAQSRRPENANGPRVDPTKNVLDLVDAESEHRDSLREADNKYQNDMRDAETRRLDELARLREKYDGRISDMLRASVQSTSELVSKQLDRLTTTLESRLAAVERSQYEVGGKTEGRGLGRSEIIAYIVAAAVVGGFIVNYFGASP